MHEWKATISKRTNKNVARGCPHCANRSLDRPCCASNTLANVKYADLIAQWDTGKNSEKKTPRDYYPSSNAKVWWKCTYKKNKKNKKSHSWEASISRRTSLHKTGCTMCNRSKMEIAMDAILKTIKSQTLLHISKWTILSIHYQDSKCNLSIPGHKSVLRADFVVHVSDSQGRELYIVVEMDGIQHFEPIQFGSFRNYDKYKALEQTKDLYQLKNDFIESRKDWRMLRISYSIPCTEYEYQIRSNFDLLVMGTFISICVGQEYKRQLESFVEENGQLSHEDEL